MIFTIEAVVGLSPDDASTKAARGLTSIGKWPQLGANAQALWGECQCNGSKPYQTQVDQAGPAFNCTYPSRTQLGVKSFVIALIRSMGQVFRYRINIALKVSAKYATANSTFQPINSRFQASNQPPDQ